MPILNTVNAMTSVRANHEQCHESRGCLPRIVLLRMVLTAKGITRECICNAESHYRESLWPRLLFHTDLWTVCTPLWTSRAMTPTLQSYSRVIAFAVMTIRSKTKRCDYARNSLHLSRLAHSDVNAFAVSETCIDSKNQTCDPLDVRVIVRPLTATLLLPCPNA